jgi:hypothetical protein
MAFATAQPGGLSTPFPPHSSDWTYKTTDKTDFRIGKKEAAPPRGAEQLRAVIVIVPDAERFPVSTTKVTRAMMMVMPSSAARRWTMRQASVQEGFEGLSRCQCGDPGGARGRSNPGTFLLMPCLYGDANAWRLIWASVVVCCSGYWAFRSQSSFS